MLTYTFCHIKGISCTAEKRLWDGGIISWDDYLKNNKRFFSYKKDQFIRKQLEISKIALEADSIDFFFSRLSNEQQVRVYPHFKNKMVFLDIETTGLSIKDDSITTIAIYNGHTIKKLYKRAKYLEFYRRYYKIFYPRHLQWYKIRYTFFKEVFWN